MKQGTSCLMAPFVALWNLTAKIFELTGRLIAIVIGLVLLIVGVILSVTIIGAIIGIPLCIFAVMLIARGLF